MLSIKQTVDSLCHKHDTRDPFEIARQLGIIVLYEPLGSIRGFYSRSKRQKFIHINHNLCSEQQRIVCAHELGHAVLHPDSNTPFLRSNTFFSVNKFEIEANRFMVQLLITDSQLLEYAQYGYTVSQLAQSAGIPEALIQYRIENI